MNGLVSSSESKGGKFGKFGKGKGLSKFKAPAPKSKTDSKEASPKPANEGASTEKPADAAAPDSAEATSEASAEAKKVEAASAETEQEPEKVEGKEPEKVEGKEPEKVEGKEPEKVEADAEPEKVEAKEAEPEKVEADAEPEEVEADAEPEKVEAKDAEPEKVEAKEAEPETAEPEAVEAKTAADSAATAEKEPSTEATSAEPAEKETAPAADAAPAAPAPADQTEPFAKPEAAAAADPASPPAATKPPPTPAATKPPPTPAATKPPPTPAATKPPPTPAAAKAAPPPTPAAAKPARATTPPPTPPPTPSPMAAAKAAKPTPSEAPPSQAPGAKRQRQDATSPLPEDELPDARPQPAAAVVADVKPAGKRRVVSDDDATQKIPNLSKSKPAALGEGLPSPADMVQQAPVQPKPPAADPFASTAALTGDVVQSLRQVKAAAEAGNAGAIDASVANNASGELVSSAPLSQPVATRPPTDAAAAAAAIADLDNMEDVETVENSFVGAPPSAPFQPPPMAAAHASTSGEIGGQGPISGEVPQQHPPGPPSGQMQAPYVPGGSGEFQSPYGPAPGAGSGEFQSPYGATPPPGAMHTPYPAGPTSGAMPTPYPAGPPSGEMHTPYPAGPPSGEMQAPYHPGPTSGEMPAQGYVPGHSGEFAAVHGRAPTAADIAREQSWKVAHPSARKWAKEREAGSSTRRSPHPFRIAAGIVMLGIAVYLLAVFIPDHDPGSTAREAASGQAAAKSSSWSFTDGQHSFAAALSFGFIGLGLFSIFRGVTYRRTVQTQCKKCQMQVDALRDGFSLKCQNGGHSAGLQIGSTAIVAGFALLAVSLLGLVLIAS